MKKESLFARLSKEDQDHVLDLVAEFLQGTTPPGRIRRNLFNTPQDEVDRLTESYADALIQKRAAAGAAPPAASHVDRLEEGGRTRGDDDDAPPRGWY